MTVECSISLMHGMTGKRYLRLMQSYLLTGGEQRMKSKQVSDKILERIILSPPNIQIKARELISTQKDKSLKDQPDILMDLAKLLNLKITWNGDEYHLEE